MYHEGLRSSKRHARKVPSRTVEAPSRAPNSHRVLVPHALLLAAILTVALCAYSNSFHAPLLLDNNEAILQDPRIRSATAGHLMRILTEPYTRLTGLYRPLTTLTYLFNYVVLGNGADPNGYHWLNFGLHAVNTALVYWLALAIFEQLPVALLATTIWSLHPVQTEAVTNIVGRADMLAAFGVLAALFCHRRALKRAGAGKAAWVAAMAIAMAIGILAKESAIVALAVIPLYDFTFGKTGPWRARIPSYAALAVPSVAFLLARAWVLANAPAVPIPFVDNPLIGAPFLAARLTAVRVIGKYLALMLWPVRLSYDYSYNEIPASGWGLAPISLGICAAAPFIAVYSYRRSKPIFFFILFFFLTLAPVSNLALLIGTIMGERLLYLPSIAFAACSAFSICAIARGLSSKPLASKPLPRGAGAAALALVLLALAVRTYARNSDWANPERFWTSGLDAAPDSFKTNLYFGKESAAWPDKNWPRAIAATDRALKILDPLPPLENVGVAYRDAAETYIARGDAAQTDRESWYRKALAALLRSEQIDLAKDERDRLLNAKRGIEGFTHIPSALYLQMGIAYSRLHDPERAVSAFERGRVLDPNAALLEQLGDAYGAAGEPRKAAAAFIEAMALDPGRAGLGPKVLDLYRQSDPQSCAADAGGGLNLGCPMVHADICGAARNVIRGYVRTRQSFAADDIRRTAVEDLGCAADALK
jgi:protein O-mannosyl-transferase